MSGSTQDEVPGSREETSSEIFKRMVVNDKKQNQFLKNKLSKGSSGSYGVSSSREQNVKPSKMRFFVVTLGVLSLSMCQMSRGVINYCITSMVDPRMLHTVSTPLPEITTILPTALTDMNDGIHTVEEAPTFDGINDVDVKSWDGENGDSTSDKGGATTIGNDHEFTTESISTVAVAETTTASSLDSNTTNYQTTTIRVDTTTTELITTTEMVATTESITTTEMVATTELVTSSITAETTTCQPNVEPDAPVEDKFMWTIKDQGLIKGGFFYSYFFFMILGGRLSEIYGAKYVLLLGVAGSALLTLATPWMARNSLLLLIVSRITMGAIQSGAFPAMYALINKWLTMSEASIYAPMIKLSLRLGQLFATLVPGLMHDWPGAFYVIGALGTIWSILWIIISTSEPATNKWVNKAELAHIMKKKRKLKSEEEDAGIDMTVMSNGATINEIKDTNVSDNNHESRKKPTALSNKKTPWIKIITSPSVIGLIVVKLTYNFCSDFVNIELASYLKFVHGASRQRVSAITTAMFAIQVSTIIFAGWLAKVMVKNRPFNISKTGIRKIFQSLSNIVGGLLLFMVTIGTCGLTEATILLQIISLALVFTAGGETMLPYDLSEEYPATIMAIANSIANLSGVTVTTLTAFVLGDEGGSQSRWNTVISLIAGAQILGGLVFCLLVKAEPIDFESKSKKNKLDDAEDQPPSYKSAKDVEMTHEASLDGQDTSDTNNKD